MKTILTMLVIGIMLILYLVHRVLALMAQVGCADPCEDEATAENQATIEEGQAEKTGINTSAG